MATLKTVSEPTYVLELSAMELRVLQAVIGNTSGASLARDLDTVFDTDHAGSTALPPEFPAVGALWGALEPR